MENESFLPEINNPKFFSNLVSKEFLTENEIRNLPVSCQQNAFNALLFLIRQQPLKQGQLCRIWADSLGVAYIELEKTIFQPEIVEKIPGEIAQKYKVIPIYQLGKTITVATSDPTNNELAQQLQNAIGLPVSLVFSLPEEIDIAISKAYHFTEPLKKFINKIASSTLFQKKDILTAAKLFEVAGNQAIVELPVCIILFAVKENAGEIHIEPRSDTTMIRFRIDGVLINRMQLDLLLHAPLISRLKTLAKIDEKENGSPLQGQIHFPLPEQRVELNLSIIPTITGEKAVLKVFPQTKSKEVKNLDQIFLSKKNYDKITTLFTAPYGLILVAGPHSTEKSGFIYSALKHINTSKMNISTVDSRVEYRIEGLNQIQVDLSAGLDPITAVQCCLLQGAEFLAIDEVRNYSEAVLLLESAYTGHLVVAGINANDSFHAILRLFQMGLKSSDVLPVLIGVIGIRVAQKLCPQCKEKYLPTTEEIEPYFDTNTGLSTGLYRAKGCRFCNDTGYSGQINFHEVLVFDNAIKKMIHSDHSLITLMEFAEKERFQNIRYDGFKKVLRGLTSIEEVNRVTMTSSP